MLCGKSNLANPSLINFLINFQCYTTFSTSRKDQNRFLTNQDFQNLNLINHNCNWKITKIKEK